MSNDNGNDFLTLKELAAATNYTTVRLRQLAHAGALPYLRRLNQYMTLELVFDPALVPGLIEQRATWAVGARIKSPPAAPPQSPDDFPTTQPPTTAADNPDALP